ncbi:MAG: HlyD family efflux transporter periplasmic adaptor subunit, partial [Planctomycetota bacterium]
MVHQDFPFPRTALRYPIAVLLILTCLCLPQTCTAQRKKKDGPTPPAPVVAEQIMLTRMYDTQSFVGVVEPSRRSTVGSPMDGRVMTFDVDAGQSVRRGDTLATLRTTAIQLQLAGANAELASRQATLNELTSGSLPSEIAAARAMENAAQAAADFAQTVFERVQRLTQQRGASASEFDEARRQRDQTKQQYLNAQSTTQLLVDGPRQERIDVAAAAVSLQEQIVAELRDRLARSVIQAPFDGVVVTEYTEVGNWLSTGAAVAEIIALSPAEVRVFVPERYINRLQIGSPCNVFVRAAQQQPFVGHIVRIVPQAQMPARTYPVIVRVANPTLETIAADANTEMTTNHAIGNASDPTGDPLTKPTSESNIPSRLAIAAGMLA